MAPSNRTPVFEVRGLNVDYGHGPGHGPNHTGGAVRAVRDVDLTLHRGEVLGLAGESGSGKSTLAYGMTRLLAPPGVVTGGQVLYHHRDGSVVDLLTMTERELREFRWKHTSIVFQGAMNSLNPVHRIVDQLTDVIRAHDRRSTPDSRLARARELLRLVGIAADRLDAYPHQLSGGMRQRVMIAMALALEPEVVIMDEPTTALDVVMQRQILRKLVRLREELGFSVLFITHDLSLLVEFSDRIAIMYGGRIVEQAPAAQIYRDPLHPYSDGLLHSFPALRGERRELTGIPGTPPDLASMPAGCPFAPRCPKVFEPCHTAMPPLLVPAVAPAAAAVPATTGTPFTALLPTPTPASAGGREVACWLHTSAD